MLKGNRQLPKFRIRSKLRLLSIRFCPVLRISYLLWQRLFLSTFNHHNSPLQFPVLSVYIVLDFPNKTHLSLSTIEPVTLLQSLNTMPANPRCTYVLTAYYTHASGSFLSQSVFAPTIYQCWPNWLLTAWDLSRTSHPIHYLTKPVYNCLSIGDPPDIKRDDECALSSKKDRSLTCHSLKPPREVSYRNHCYGTRPPCKQINALSVGIR